MELGLAVQRNGATSEAAGSVFRGSANGNSIIVTLRPGPCQDTMADIEYETRVEVSVGEQKLVGCGNPLH